MKHADTYKCPCCGAGVNIPYGHTNAACEYCGNRITVALENEEYASIIGTIREAMLKEIPLRNDIANIEYKIQHLEALKHSLNSPGKMKKENIVCLAIDISTFALLIILGVFFYFLWENDSIEVENALLILAIILLLGGLASFICYLTIPRSIKHRIQEIDKSLEISNNSISRSRAQLNVYMKILSDNQNHIKLLRRTDPESLEYMQYVLYIGDAQNIPEACRLNERRIQEKHQKETAEKRRRALDAAETERIKNQQKMIELERQRLQLEKEKLTVQKGNNNKEEIGVGKLLAGGAIIAGTALVLGPVAAGVAAKIMKDF